MLARPRLPCQVTVSIRHLEQVAAAVGYVVPAIHQSRAFAAAGGLMSYGGSFTETHRRVSTPAAFARARSQV
jgi:hypothetical protein